MRWAQIALVFALIALAAALKEYVRGGVSDREGPFRVKVLRVIDGDTLKVDINLGLGIWLRGQSVRVYGIDCPELPTPAGSNALALTSGVAGELATIVTWGRDKYGRILGSLAPDVGPDLATRLLDAGLAREYLP